MPTLICTLLGSAGLDALLPGLRSLHEAGEAVVIWAPRAAGRRDGTTPIRDRAGLDRAWEDEQLPMVAGAEAGAAGDIILPAWLPAADCDRVLAIATEALAQTGNVRWADWRARAGRDPDEVRLFAVLFAAGCEAVEMLGPADVEELHQSWTSGRRAGLRVFQ